MEDSSPRVDPDIQKVRKLHMLQTKQELLLFNTNISVRLPSSKKASMLFLRSRYL